MLQQNIDTCVSMTSVCAFNANTKYYRMITNQKCSQVFGRLSTLINAWQDTWVLFSVDYIFHFVFIGFLHYVVASDDDLITICMETNTQYESLFNYININKLQKNVYMHMEGIAISKRTVLIN